MPYSTAVFWMKPVTLQEVRDFWSSNERECHDCPWLREYTDWDDGKPQQFAECSILEDLDIDPANCPGVS